MHTSCRPVVRALVALASCALLVPTLSSVANAKATVERRAAQRTHVARTRVNVTITAAYYDPYVGPDPDTNAGRNLEYIVIRNGGSHTVRLGGWTLRDLARTGQAAHVFRFPKFRLGAGKTVRIHTGTGSKTRSNLYWGSSTYIWGDDADRATLKNSGGTTMSTCSWGSSDTSPTFC